MAAVRTVEHVSAGTAMLAGAAAPLPGTLVCLSGQQFGEEGGKVNRYERLPVRAAV